MAINKKTATITIGDESYIIPKLKVGQLERVCEVFSDDDIKTTNKPFAILRIVMENSDPKVADFEELDPDVDEVKEVVNKVAELSNMAKKPKEDAHPLASSDGAEKNQTPAS